MNARHFTTPRSRRETRPRPKKPPLALRVTLGILNRLNLGRSTISLTLHIGPTPYAVSLVRGHCHLPNGAPALGLCDPDRGQIQISDVPAPPKRVQVLLHELAHAVRAEFDPRGGGLIDEETHCELASKLWIHPHQFGRLMGLMWWGYVPDSVVWLPGVEAPLPATSAPAAGATK